MIHTNFQPYSFYFQPLLPLRHFQGFFSFSSSSSITLFSSSLSCKRQGLALGPASLRHHHLVFKCGSTSFSLTNEISCSLFSLLQGWSCRHIFSSHSFDSNRFYTIVRGVPKKNVIKQKYCCIKNYFLSRAS